MNIKPLLKELKSGILTMIKETFSAESSSITKELDGIINGVSDKMKRWTLLVKNGAITQDEFVWLLKSERALFQMKSLKALGVSQIKLGHFKSKVIKFVGSATFKFVGL